MEFNKITGNEFPTSDDENTEIIVTEEPDATIDAENDYATFGKLNIQEETYVNPIVDNENETEYNEEALKEINEPKRNVTENEDVFYHVKTVDFTGVTKNAIKKLRRKTELSEKHFADILGVTIETVENWENGTQKPKSTTLRLLYILIKEPELLADLYKLIKK